MPQLIKRKLKLIKSDEAVREIIMMNYLRWPDHGAPEQTDFQIIKTLIDLMHEHLRAEDLEELPQGK